MENFTESRAWAEWYSSQLCGPGPAPLDVGGSSEAGYVFAAATPNVRDHLLTLKPERSSSPAPISGSSS